jgi:hypothetical protein
MDRRKQLFNPKTQLLTIKKYESLVKSFYSAKTIKEWNALRINLSDKFPGTPQEKLMLFGYIDGILHSQIFKKQEHEQLINTT